MQSIDVAVRFLMVVILALTLLATLSAVCGALIFRRILREAAREDERADLTRTAEDYMKWLGRAVAALGLLPLALVFVYVVLPLTDEAMRMALIIALVLVSIGIAGVGKWVSDSSGERAIRAARSAARRTDTAANQ